MNRIIRVAVAIICLFIVSTIAESGRTDIGMFVMLGGRYDNLRMCVASKKGVKGGLIADVMLRVTHGFSERFDAGVEIPIMRPVLFGVAFKMLQFEPQMVFQYKIPGERSSVIIGPALGASFHYGPDYNSDRQDRSQSFFAAGPIVGVRGGVLFNGDDQQEKYGFAVRPFYVALFSKDHGRGTVIGGAAEYIHTF